MRVSGDVLWNSRNENPRNFSWIKVEQMSEKRDNIYCSSMAKLWKAAWQRARQACKNYWYFRGQLSTFNSKVWQIRFHIPTLNVSPGSLYYGLSSIQFAWKPYKRRLNYWKKNLQFSLKHSKLYQAPIPISYDICSHRHNYNHLLHPNLAKLLRSTVLQILSTLDGGNGKTQAWCNLAKLFYQQFLTQVLKYIPGHFWNFYNCHKYFK